MVKNEKFQCPSERGGPENFKNHPTFVPSAIFGGVMASQNMVNFFLGHPVDNENVKLLTFTFYFEKIYTILWYGVTSIVPHGTSVLLFSDSSHHCPLLALSQLG